MMTPKEKQHYNKLRLWLSNQGVYRGGAAGMHIPHGWFHRGVKIGTTLEEAQKWLFDNTGKTLPDEN